MKTKQTTERSEQNSRAVIIAAMAASLLMLVLGLTHRTIATLLCPPVNKVPIDSAALNGLALQIGGWTGQDTPLDETIVRRTATDAHVNRRYSRSSGLENVSLYVACGIRTHELMVHRPEVCYISAGWLLVNCEPMELPLNDGTGLPCRILQFVWEGLYKERVTVLSYFFVDGQRCGDPSLWRSKSWRGFAEVGYVAQVQIVASSTETQMDESVMKLVCTFAADSASAVAGLFEGIESDSKAESSHSKKMGGSRQ